MRWNQGRHRIERQCTCKGARRGYDCGPEAFHVVGSAELEEVGRAVLEECKPLSDAAYRLKDSQTGEIIAR